MGSQTWTPRHAPINESLNTLAWVNEAGNFPASTHLYLYAAELDELIRGAQLVLAGSSTIEDMAASLQRVHDAQAAKQ